MFITLPRSIQRTATIITLLALLATSFPLGVMTALAARTGVTLVAQSVSAATTSTNISLKATIGGDGQDTATLNFSDNSGGGIFSNGNTSGGCTSELSTTSPSLTVASGTSNKGFCYKNDVAGTYTLSVELVASSTSIDTADIVVTITDPVVVSPTVSACVSYSAVHTTDLGTWDLSETRLTGHNELLDDSLHVWTEGTTSNDKAAGYYATDFALADIGEGFSVTSTGTSSPATALPALQIVLSSGQILVYEPGAYGVNNVWSNQVVPGLIAGAGYVSFGSVNDILAASSTIRVSAIGYSLGSGVLGDHIIEKITVGCIEYTFGLPVIPPTFSANTTVVTPDNMQNWAFFTENAVGGQSGQIVEGPAGQPLGSGSAQFVLTDSSEAQVLGTTELAGTPLKDITALTYQTYRTASADPAQAPALAFEFDNDVTDADTGWRGRMVYEPYHAHTVNTGVWEEWNTLDNAPAGNWWGSGNALSTLDEECPQSNPCTWQEVLTKFPNAGIRDAGAGTGLLLFKAGSGWANFDGNVDKLVIGIKTGNNIHTETYDFDPNPPVTPITNSSGGTSSGGRAGNSGTDGPTPQVLGASTDEELYQLLEAIKQRLTVLLLESYASGQTPVPVPGQVAGVSVPSVNAQVPEIEDEEIEEDITTPSVIDGEDENVVEEALDKDWTWFAWVFVILWLAATATAFWRRRTYAETLAVKTVQLGFGAVALILLAIFFMFGVVGIFWPALIVAVGAITTFFWTLE